MSTGVTLRPEPSSSDAFCTSGTSPTLPTIHLIGAGKVGRELLELLAASSHWPPSRLPKYRLVSVTDSTATIYRREGLPPGAVAHLKRQGVSLGELEGSVSLPPEVAIELVGADVVVDAAASGIEPPESRATWVEAALRIGASVALASKDALAVFGHRWLGIRSVGCNAALGGTGLRLLAELDDLRRAAESTVAIVGNASTTAVLSEIERGASLPDGIDVARRRGLLESDLERDLGGLDAACKLSIVAGALTGSSLDPQGIPRQDLRTLDPARVRDRFERGATTRLVARLDERGASVSYEEVPKGSPLACPSDRVVYVYGRPKTGPPPSRAFESGRSSALPAPKLHVHVGYGLGPAATARAILEDVDHLCAVRSAKGGGR